MPRRSSSKWDTEKKEKWMTESFGAKRWQISTCIASIVIVLAFLPVPVNAQVTTTTVQGTVYRADGSAATGTVLVSWPAFSTATNQAVAAGTKTAKIGPDGFLSVNLAPNQGAYPSGSYYTVVYHLNDGTVSKEYWTVPATTTAAIAAVRAQLAPSTVAVQPVGKSYVDTSIAAITGNYLPLSGGALTGALVLPGDPTASSQAATKHYADALASTELSLAGGTLSGTLNVPNGVTNYSESIVSTKRFLIERRLNEPSRCTFTVAPLVVRLVMPVRHGRVVVTDSNGVVLFTGYVATEPAVLLVGQADAGPALEAHVSAVSDEILLDQQQLPSSQPGVSASANQLLQALNARLGVNGISFALTQNNGTVGEFSPDAGQSWSKNAGALASMARSAYRAINGTVTMTPVGNVVHQLNEENGTLAAANLEASMAKALANDITVCGPSEPAAYVTELFQGDGTTTQFNLTEEPYFPPAPKAKPLTELFQEPAINTQIWQVNDSGSHLSLTASGLTCSGGDGIDGDTALSLVNELEIGGSLVIQAGGVRFGSMTQGVINGLYYGAINMANCLAGFQITQPGGSTLISPLVNGVVAGSSFSPLASHLYTLRVRISCNEMQRVLQSYNSIDDSGTHTYGGVYLSSGGNVMLEVQDMTGGVATTPVILYSGTVANAPSTMALALISSANLQCSVASFEISQQGPVWVASTPPGGGTVVRRMGTTAQGGDCTVERSGRLRFYATTVPAPGELVAISYRTAHRSVARRSSAQSIAQESLNGQLPGTAAWMGTVTHPATRSSMDCENAASALLDLATSRAAAWTGKYTAWNMQQQADVWPGDVLAVNATSTGLNANLVVRNVEIDLLCTSPELTKYVLTFANDWADALAIKTSATVPADVWVPQQPETTPPLASLTSLSVTAVTGSAIQVSANVTPPVNGGFEVRRRDWAFGPGTNSDLVLRSPVANFTIPREAVTERYFIRMYDGSTPPNYSRFSSAVFVNVAL